MVLRNSSPNVAEPQSVVGWCRTMHRIVRPTDHHVSPGGPRRDESRFDPPYSRLPREPPSARRCAHGAAILLRSILEAQFLRCDGFLTWSSDAKKKHRIPAQNEQGPVSPAPPRL